MITSVFRADPTNVGDWYCAPFRFFPFKGPVLDILDLPRVDQPRGMLIVGGGGLVAETFRPAMERLAANRRDDDFLIAWGIGESLNIDRRGGPVLPYAGSLPDYLRCFDMIGVRDYGTEYPWTPCASCLLPQFDTPAGQPRHEIVIYEHKRIPIPIEGFPRRSNDGGDIEAVLDFLASGSAVITNSYHGAYWATLLGRRVLAFASMSKLYRMKHPPVIGTHGNWRRLIDLTVAYPDALSECRAASHAFHDQMRQVLHQ